MSRISNNSFAVNSSLEQKIDIATVSAAGIPISGTANVDVVANSIGLATSSAQSSTNANLATIITNQGSLATESTLSNVSSELSNQTTDLNNIASSTSSTDSSCQNIDTNTSNIDSSTSTMSSTLSNLDTKVTQGSDAALSSAQQVLLYARNSGGGLDALQVNGSGELVVTTSGGSATHSGSQANLMNAVSASNGTTSNIITTTSSKSVNIFGVTTGTNGLEVQQSADNTNWYNVGYSIYPDMSGNFQQSFSDVIANYWRIKATETSTITATLLHS